MLKWIYVITQRVCVRVSYVSCTENGNISVLLTSSAFFHKGLYWQYILKAAYLFLRVSTVLAVAVKFQISLQENVSRSTRYVIAKNILLRKWCEARVNRISRRDSKRKTISQRVWQTWRNYYLHRVCMYSSLMYESTNARWNPHDAGVERDSLTEITSKYISFSFALKKKKTTERKRDKYFNRRNWATPRFLG